MSPLCLEQMLISYYSAAPYEFFLNEDRFDSRAGKEARQWLKDNGLINDEDGKATDRGRFWVEALLATPLPVQTWSMPTAEPVLGAPNTG